MKQKILVILPDPQHVISIVNSFLHGKKKNVHYTIYLKSGDQYINLIDIDLEQMSCIFYEQEMECLIFTWNTFRALNLKPETK